MNHAEIKLSIVIPAYNEEEILETEIKMLILALDEAFKQLRYEVILVENGSTDHTKSIATSLALLYPQIKVISLPEGNYGNALNIIKCC